MDSNYMMVPKAWLPIMEEIERRAEKFSEDTQFSVLISTEDLQAVNDTPPLEKSNV